MRAIFQRLESGQGPPYARSCWPREIQRTLCSFNYLRRLTLRVQLMRDSFQFVPVAAPGAPSAVHDEFARKTVLELIEGFGKSAAIEVLVVVFRSIDPGSIVWTYTVQ